jgi:phosphoesterase RecJ-like protein
MNAATFERDGRLAWAVVDPGMLAGLRLDRDEVRSMVNVLGDIEGVEIAVLFKTFGDDTVKVSMRSRGTVELHDVAQTLGGGGHPFAAGADVRQPLAEVTQRTLDLLRAKMAK